MIITGEYIKQLREEIGMSQQQVAKLAGISQAHVAKIETGNVDPRLSTVNSVISVLENRGKIKECRNYMKKPVALEYNTEVRQAIDIMKKNNISQLPVFNKEKMVGSIKESTIIEKTHRGFYNIKVVEIMDKPFPVLDFKEDIETVKTLLDYSQAVLISKNGNIVGIITKTDLL